MRGFLRALRRFRRGDRAAAIIEFALVVPIFFMIVWGIISFSRAYQRLNTLSTSLREGARVGATLPGPIWTSVEIDRIKAATYNFSSAYGYPIDTSRVTVTKGTYDVTVGVTGYALFAGLTFVGNLQSVTVTRSAVFRLER